MEIDRTAARGIRGHGRRRPRRVALFGAAFALTLAGTGGLAPAGAQEGPADPVDPVADALVGPDALDSLRDLERLERDTAGPDAGGVPIGIVVDRNGDSPGGIGVTRVMVEPAQAEALTERADAIDGVVSAAVDRRMTAAADPYVSSQYGPTSVRANLLGTNADGLGVVVAVIDSGVAGGHPDLSPTLRNGQPRVLTGTSFLKPGPGGGPDLTGQPGNLDPSGHGTHVAGIISAARDNGLGGSGVAPGAQILPIRVLDAAGDGWESDIAAGVLHAHQQGADIINLSLSGEGPQSVTLSNVIELVSTNPTLGKPPSLVVAAAGNDGSGSTVQWPAAHQRVLAVGATDSAHQVAWFSSHGDYVDVAAPGAGIVSTCATNTYTYSYCQKSGTSMATPLVAGAAAILRQQQAEDPTQLRARLENSTRDIWTHGWDRASGYGEIDLAAAYDPSTWPRSPLLPVPPPPTPATPPPVRLPWGYFNEATVDGNRVRLGGRVADHDGTPPVIVSSAAFGDRAVWPNSMGYWSTEVEITAGTYDVCAKVLDEPTRTGVDLGCRRIVK